MIKSVFKIISVEHSESLVQVLMQVNANSDIFKGHFPDQPVVPGACMLQIVKDVLADTLKLKLQLLKADNIKFLNLVTPGLDLLQLNIDYQHINEQLKIGANLMIGETVCMKFSGTFSY